MILAIEWMLVCLGLLGVHRFKSARGTQICFAHIHRLTFQMPEFVIKNKVRKKHES